MLFLSILFCLGLVVESQDFPEDFQNDMYESTNFEANGDAFVRSTDSIKGDASTESFCQMPRLQVKYGTQEITCGMLIPLKDVSGDDGPTIGMNAVSHGEWHTLIMYDPDAPSQTDPKCRSWLHWLVVNIKGSELSTGKELTGYNPPTPPAGSGFHRYRFLLLKQKGAVPENHVTKRCGFNVDEFVEGYDLTVSASNEFKTKQE